MQIETLLIESFGALTTAETYENAQLTREDVAEAALTELDNTIGLTNVHTIITGMNAKFTYALQDVTETGAFSHIDIQPFYPDVKSIMQREDLDYQDAWKQGYNWRNNKVMIPDEDDASQTIVDLVVRVGDAGNNGEELLKQARRATIGAFDINLDNMIDKNTAYGDNSTADSTADTTTDTTTGTATNTPDVETLDGIGEAYGIRLRDNGIETAADLSKQLPDALEAEIDGLSADRAADWIATAEAAT